MKARANDYQNAKTRASVTVISSPEEFEESQRRLAERRRTEEASERALRELSGRLITSQEEERRRVARELHDNIGQELALLALHAQRIDSGASEAQGTTHHDVHELHKRITEVATKVSNLSHRLHSSELEFLGLTIAADRFCRDFSRCYGIDVEYVVKDVPQDLDKGVALCFYRLIQESLQNVAKHSNAKSVLFRLTGGSDQLRLEVRDKGIGFDAKHVPYDSGLGLVSMRERMNLIGGTFSIRSKPGQGTTVEASVALPVAK
jgi:signal transduction histidine kinase